MDIKMNFKKMVIASSVIFFNGAGIAQESGAIDLGGFELIPAVDITHALDDNVTRVETGKIDSWKRTLSPEAVLRNEFGVNALQFGYRLERGDYFSSSQDNYTDHFLSALLNYEFNGRHRTQTNFQYTDGHDDRGTSFSTNTNNATPDTFNQFNAGVLYSYGAISAVSRIDINFNHSVIDYDGVEELFLVRDRDNTTIGGVFYYQVAPATDLLVDYSHNVVSYDFTIAGAETLNSTNSSLLAGVKWESTAATSSFAKIGYQEKDFDSAQREDFSGFDWEVGVKWNPIDRSVIEFSTQSNTNETNGEGNFIKQKSYGANWTHQWLERMYTRVSFSVINDVYEESVSSREDDLTQLNMTLNYQLKRWLSVTGSYLYDDRDSNVTNIDYDRSVFSIGFKVTL
jgi:hypothetical protein